MNEIFKPITAPLKALVNEKNQMKALIKTEPTTKVAKSKKK